MPESLGPCFQSAILVRTIGLVERLRIPLKNRSIPTTFRWVVANVTPAHLPKHAEPCIFATLSVNKRFIVDRAGR